MKIHRPASEDGTSTQKSVTVMIHCQISESEREPFITELQADLQCFRQRAGVLTANLFETQEDGQIYLTIIKTFASQAEHQHWLDSHEFTLWKAKIEPAQPSPNAIHRYYGMETLFQPHTTSSPSAWKMAIVLTLAAFPCSYVLSRFFGEALAQTPPLLGAMITSPIMVIIMSYIMVPLLSRLLSRWLNAKQPIS